MTSRKGLCFPCYKCCHKKSSTEEEEEEEEREGLLDRPENTLVKIPAEFAEGNITEEAIVTVDASQISNVIVNNSESKIENALEQKVETDNLNKCSPDDFQEFNNILKKKIRHVFQGYITAKSILYVFHKYNVGVLTETDIVDVKYTIKKNGPIEGANLLLDRLVVYKGWFHCLIQVLKDPKVRFIPAADQLEKIQDELCIEYPQFIKLTENVISVKTPLEEITHLSTLTADNEQNVKGRNRNAKYIPSQVNIFQEIIARQDKKIMLEEIIKLNDIKAELHQSLMSKDIQVKQITDANEELTLQLQMSREEKQTLMQQIAKVRQDAIIMADEVIRVNHIKEHLEQDLKSCKDELDQFTSRLQVNQKETQMLKDEKDQVCDSCKQKREKKKVEKSRYPNMVLEKMDLDLLRKEVRSVVVRREWDTSMLGMAESVDVLLSVIRAGVVRGDIRSDVVGIVRFLVLLRDTVSDALESKEK